MCGGATSPGSPTPQHHFPDPQKLVARFHSQFSRTGPKTVLRARRPLVGFGSYFNTFRRIHTYRSGIASSTCGRDHVDWGVVSCMTALPGIASSRWFSTEIAKSGTGTKIEYQKENLKNFLLSEPSPSPSLSPWKNVLNTIIAHEDPRREPPN